MTTLEYIAQWFEVTLGCILIVKLLKLRLHVVYRLFSLFLAVELLGSLSWLVQRFVNPALAVDYRLLYVAQRAIACTLIIFTVYALLGAVLRTLPGILTVSRRLLKVTFFFAAIVGVLSWTWEYQHSGYSAHNTWQDSVLFEWLLTERVVSSIVLLVIVGILTFLLYFPVQIPRNLAIFTVGFSVYSAGFTASLLVQSLWVHDTSRWVSTSNEFLMGACFAYWALFITPAGEIAPARLNMRRNPEEHARLVRSLELLNESLIRSASR